MNFLAHALLAGDSPALIVGGVIGDWIKGPLPGQLPVDIAKGVRLHRAIDSFAESNAAFCASRQRMSADRRRYAGVLVDIFYDHLLAKHWPSLHTDPLPMFAHHVYSLITERLADLPPSSHQALKLMAEEDWLSSYASINGIADILRRMGLRARQPNPLTGGEIELLANESDFQADFTAWLADANVFSNSWRTENIPSR